MPYSDENQAATVEAGMRSMSSTNNGKKRMQGLMSTLQVKRDTKLSTQRLIDRAVKRDQSTKSGSSNTLNTYIKDNKKTHQIIKKKDPYDLYMEQQQKRAK